MGQEFIIKSQALEDKINQLLPSQGGFQAGVDLSASTQIVPIIDLTESAEGSDVRADLQTSLSLSSTTAFDINNETDTVLINTTGYYKVFGNGSVSATGTGDFKLTDGTTTRRLLTFNAFTVNGYDFVIDFTVFLKAGDSLIASANATGKLLGVTRQIADINGNLVNP